MVKTPQYEASLVATIRELVLDNVQPQEMVKRNLVNVDIKTVMSILKDSRQHGWDKISARPVFDEEEEDTDNQATDGIEDEDMVTFGSPEGHSTDEPQIAEDARENISRAKAGKRLARGKKPPNTTDNKALNAERRRRRGGNPLDSRRRLLMDMRKIDPDFTYRWFLDRPGRLQEKTQLDDWEIVTDAHAVVGQGGTVTAIAGTNHYNANKMILMRKPKAWYQEDKQEEARSVSELENQIIQPGGQSAGNGVGPKALLDKLKNSRVDNSNMYVPEGERNSIGRVTEEP